MLRALLLTLMALMAVEMARAGRGCCAFTKAFACSSLVGCRRPCDTDDPEPKCSLSFLTCWSCPGPSGSVSDGRKYCGKSGGFMCGGGAPMIQPGNKKYCAANETCQFLDSYKSGDCTYGPHYVCVSAGFALHLLLVPAVYNAPESHLITGQFGPGGGGASTPPLQPHTHPSTYTPTTPPPVLCPGEGGRMRNFFSVPFGRPVVSSGPFSAKNFFSNFGTGENTRDQRREGGRHHSRFLSVR